MPHVLPEPESISPLTVLSLFWPLSPFVLRIQVCRVLSASHMECPSPPINFEALINARRQVQRRWALPSSLSPSSLSPPSPMSLRRKRSFRPNRDVPRSVSLRIGFVMDGVESVRDLKKHFQNLQYVEDPMYSPFIGASLVKLYKGDTLVIEGENLNLASDETDVNVTIGTRPCNVTSLAATQLVCTPPEVQPPGTDEIGIKTESRLPLVVVRVGQNLRFPIGESISHAPSWHSLVFPHCLVLFPSRRFLMMDFL